MKKGTVVWFNNGKGYGFIRPEDGKNDIFVHHTCIDMDGYRTIKEGQVVTFDIDEGPIGRPQAVKVKPVEA